MNREIISLKNIHKSYMQGKNKINILNGANLSVKEGELIGIIGASGSGKSTLLHIAGLLDSCTNGQINICDVEINKSTEKNINKLRLEKIGFVYQYHHLLGDFTAIENIILPQLLLNIPKDKAIIRASDLMKKLGLKNKENNFPGELSGGEQQRVAIARAFANQPKIILADEPTGNLDPHTSKEVFELLVNNAKENNVATIIVTHNHELAAKMDKTFLLKDGQLV